MGTSLFGLPTGVRLPSLDDKPNIPLHLSQLAQDFITNIIGERVYTDTVIQTVSPGDLTSGSYTTVATCTPAFVVPSWAQDGTRTAYLTCSVNAVNITAASMFLYKMTVLSTDSTIGECGGGSTNPESANIIVGMSIPIPATTTSLVPVVSALRTSGTGALRINPSGGNPTGGTIWTLTIK